MTKEQIIKRLVETALIKADFDPTPEIHSDLYAEKQGDDYPIQEQEYTDETIVLVEGMDIWLNVSFIASGFFKDEELDYVEFDVKKITLFLFEEEVDYTNDKDIRETILTKLNEL